jgi:hypothetical protein
MQHYTAAAQIVIAVSIVIVWVGRFDNIVKEFRQFGLSDLVRSLVGATKISLATLLVAGIWYPVPVVGPALVMAVLMLGAQGAHLSVRNPWYKFVPSFGLLLLSLFVAGVHAGFLPQ